MSKIILSEFRYKVDWFKVKIKDSGINIYLQNIKENREEYRLVKRNHYSKGQYWGVILISELYELIQKNTYIYEILELDIRKKVYFDCDPTRDTLNECKEVILKVFVDANFQISGYQNQLGKCSYHIILSNYTIENEIELMKIKQFAAQHKELGFDTAVYGKFNLFKCINQSKPKIDAPIQAYLEGSQVLSKHLVTCDFDEVILPWDTTLKQTELTVKNRLVTQKLDILQINQTDVKYELSDPYFDYVNAMAIEKLNIIPNPFKENINTIEHNTNFKIMAWCKSEGITFNEFWNWCKTKTDAESRRLRYLEYY